MTRWAPDNAQGLHPYVVTTFNSWLRREFDRVVYASSVKDAEARHRAQYGWPPPTSIRLATPEDIPTTTGGAS